MAGSIAKKTGKIFLWILGIIILLVFALFIFIQTNAFNKLALEYTLDELNSSQKEKHNKINTESIEGNILNGIRLNKGSVTVFEDTLLSFSYLEVKYNLWGLLDKRISLETVFMSEPVIFSSKIRAGDSTIWNFENLLSTDKTDTSTSEFDWDINVENLRIENGFIRVEGDTSRAEPRWREKRTFMQFFDFNKADIYNLNIDLNAKYYTDFKSVTLNNLSFNTNSDFNIHKLQLNANIHEKDSLTELWNFDLITDRSDIKIYHLSADNFNPFADFNYEELGEKDVELNLDIKKFNFDDLTFFIPGLNFLDSVVGVKLEAKGKYKDLYAENLRVWLPNSVINVKGKVVNLHKPDSLYLDVEGRNIEINAADIKTIYKGELSDYSHLGKVYADLHFRGQLTDFYSDFRLNTGAGFAEGVFNFNSANEKYSGFIETRNLNIGKITKDNSLNSSLNISAKFDGTGFDMNKLNTNVVYSAASSRFGKYDIRYSGGEIHANRGNIRLNIRHVSSMGDAVVSGTAKIININNPVYNLKGTVRNLNIAAITGESENKSDLNFTFDVNGRGASLENINGSYKLNIDNSYFGEYQIPETPVIAEIQSNNSSGRINVVTDMAEFRAEGSFKFSELADVIMLNVETVESIINKSITTETSAVVKVDTTGSIILNPSENLKFSYRFVTKDSVKLSSVLKPFGINFNGSAEGDISNSPDNFSSNLKLDLRNFSYNDTAIVLKNLKTDFVFNNDYTRSINSLKIDLFTGADVLYLNAQKFDSLNLAYNMNGNIADLKLSSKKDTTVNADISGKLNFNDGLINADFDSVNVIYSGYNIQNSGNWVFNFEQGDKFSFQQFDIKSRNAILKLNGYFSLENESDLSLAGDNIKIQDIAAIVNKADSSYILSAENDINGEITNLNISYKGTFEQPEVTVDIKSNTLVYKETDIGTINGEFDYKEENANALLELKNAESNGTLTITGKIPFRNPLSADTLHNVSMSSAPVEINLKAQNFLLDYFATLVSGIASLRGVMNADLTAKGTAEDPALSGNMKISDGGYLLPLTGMDYSFNADISTDNFKLVLNRLTLFNEGDEDRHIDIYGSLDFKDLKITDIDLQASGDMVLLDKSVEENDLEVYGYILAGSGTPPIKITGSLDSLFVTGQLLIKDATISSIPLEGSGYNAFEDNFVYIDNNNFTNLLDTLKAGDTLKIVTEEEYIKLNPFERLKYRVSGDSAKETFVNLDLNVRTEQNIYASIDFNNITRDRLFGELKADLDIKTENGQVNAYGTVDVAGDSYYRFYRDFKLNESRIKFDGDIANPILDIKGVYASQKNNEQYGSVTTSDVEVVVSIKGNVKQPELTISLYQDGNEVAGSDAQSDAITYLLFGRFKSELTASERTAVASSLGASVGSLYASSYLSQTIREVLPFIVDAQFTYTEGNVQNTDIELISDVGDARVKFGGKLLKQDKQFEVVVDYPLNQLLKLNLPETLLLEFAREEKKQSLTTNTNDILTTEVKILYKIKF